MTDDPSDYLSRAYVALEGVQDNPDRSARDARDLLARLGLGPEARVVALFALGRARHEQGAITEACQILSNAAYEARGNGFHRREAQIRSSRALSLFMIGEAQLAFEELEFAESHSTGGERGRVLAQRSLIEIQKGDLDLALTTMNRALGLLVEAGDELAATRAIVSRGAAYSLLGNLDAAENDFLDAERAATALGQHALAASAQANIAFAYGRRGDIPAALTWFEKARTSYGESGDPARYMAILEADLCEVLLLAGLHEEAVSAAERALELSREGGNVTQHAEAQLLLARVHLARRNPNQSAEAARKAVTMFADAGRPAWASQARYVALQAGQARAPARDSRGMAAEIIEITDELRSHGWVVEALHARTMAGRILLDCGEIETARACFQASAGARNQGTADLRVQAWYATALLRLAEGNRPGARRAVGSGMRVLDNHLAVLGATELRAHSSVHSSEISRLGLQLALEAGRPANILRWVERARAAALRLPPVRPPDDAVVADGLADLRRLNQELDGATRAGSATIDLHRQVVGAEKRIQRHVRLARGSSEVSPGSFDPTALRSQLSGRVLVEYFVLDGVLQTLVVNERLCRLAAVASITDVELHLDNLLFSLRRLATGRSSPAVDVIYQGYQESAAALDKILLGDLRLPTDADLVVVPSRILHGVPWSALPSMQERSWCVSPSASIWQRSARARSGVGHAALVAGSGLPAADREVERLRNLYDQPAVLSSASATAEATLNAAAAADVLHVAAHGTFRSDSPMFSSLQLSDGPLTVYDLERLPRLPRIVVLSACHAAATVEMGEEVFGTAMALIGMGVSSVVAPLIAIVDQTTSEFMLELHQDLAAGVDAPAALARAVAEFGPRNPHSAATAAAFVVISTDCGS